MTSRTPTPSLFWEKTHLLFHQIHSKYRNIDIWTSGETKLVVPVQMKTRFKYWSAVAQKMIYKLQRKQSEVRILDLCFLLNLFLLYIPFKGEERQILRWQHVTQEHCISQHRFGLHAVLSILDIQTFVLSEWLSEWLSKSDFTLSASQHRDSV